MLVKMHITDWAKAQREDPVLSAVFDWLEVQKKMDLKTLLAEHASSEEGSTDLVELTELHDSSGSPIPALQCPRARVKILCFS